MVQSDFDFWISFPNKHPLTLPYDILLLTWCCQISRAISEWPLSPIDFLAYLAYQPKSLIQSCFVCRASSATSMASASALSGHTFPCHKFKHRNLILLHTCTSNIWHFWLVVLNGSPFGNFLWFAILPLKTVIEISHHIYLCITSLPTYIKGIMPLQLIYEIFQHFLNPHAPYFSKTSCALTYGLLRPSCVFLANYVLKCQMSSGPYGPICSLYTLSCLIQGHSQSDVLYNSWSDILCVTCACLESYQGDTGNCRPAFIWYKCHMEILLLDTGLPKLFSCEPMFAFLYFPSNHCFYIVSPVLGNVYSQWEFTSEIRSQGLINPVELVPNLLSI